MRFLSCFLIAAVMALPALADAPALRQYVCHKTAKAPKLDGKLDDAVWKNVHWTADFADIEGAGKPVPRFRTHAKMLWDDQALYIAAELEEPQVWATLTQRDVVVYADNDFEIFIDPNGDNFEYAELELNAFGTPWDLLLPLPYKDGGRPMEAWNLVKTRIAIAIQGTINNPKDTDKGWTIEIAIPWSDLAIPTQARGAPKDGDLWKMNFSRVEWQVEVKDGKIVKVPGKPEDNWVWSPTGILDIHRPEAWGTIQFSSTVPGTSVAIRADPLAEARTVLHQIYYAQREFYAKNNRWAKDLAELGLVLPPTKTIVAGPTIKIVDPHWKEWKGWLAEAEVAMPDGTRKPVRIRHDSWFTIDEKAMEK
jgi:hypothetical protein